MDNLLEYEEEREYLEDMEKDLPQTVLDDWAAKLAQWSHDVMGVKKLRDLDDPFVPDIDEGTAARVRSFGPLMSLSRAIIRAGCSKPIFPTGLRTESRGDGDHHEH